QPPQPAIRIAPQQQHRLDLRCMHTVPGADKARRLERGRPGTARKQSHPCCAKSRISAQHMGGSTADDINLHFSTFAQPGTAGCEITSYFHAARRCIRVGGNDTLRPYGKVKLDKWMAFHRSCGCEQPPACTGWRTGTIAPLSPVPYARTVAGV